jgi:hypothetical protein
LDTNCRYEDFRTYVQNNNPGAINGQGFVQESQFDSLLQTWLSTREGQAFMRDIRLRQGQIVASKVGSSHFKGNRDYF